jgi:hypothetical protein
MWRAANRSIQSHNMHKARAAVLLGIAFVFLASSCGQSTQSATLPPSAIPSPTPTSSPPPGGPVPAQLLGDWFLPPAAVTEVSGFPCPSNPTTANCFFQLTLTATAYTIYFVPAEGIAVPSQGDVVVNHNEADFFNAVTCASYLPLDGVGRYTWRVTAGVLYFALINPATNADYCTRAHVFTNRGWSRKH